MKKMKIAVATVLMIYNVAEAGDWVICQTPTGGTTFCRGNTPPPAQALSTVPATQAVLPQTPAPQMVTGTIIGGTDQQPDWCRNGKPQTPTETVICSTQPLWAWDTAYNTVWRNTPKSARPNGMAVLKDRDQYTNPGQIAAWYQSALSQLNTGQVTQAAGSSGVGNNDSGSVIKWCGKPNLNKAESTLCELAKVATALATYETQLNDAYKTSKKLNASLWEQEKQKQRTWLEQRNMLLLSVGQADPQVAATQLIQLYQKRIAELQPQP